MKPFNKKNIEEYKHFGPLTQPFLDKDYVYNKILTDLKNKQKDENSTYFLTSLILWIHKEVKYSKEDNI